MGVRLPRNSGELLPLRSVRAVRRSVRTSWAWSMALLLILAASLTLAVAAPTAAFPLTALPWIVAPFLAAAAWAHAAGRAEDRVRPAFRTFQAAALLGLAAQGLYLFQVSGPRGAGPMDGIPLTAYLLFVPYAVIAGGAALALGKRRGRFWSPRLTADGLLLLLLALAPALRLVVEPMADAAPSRGLELVLLAGIQSVTVVAAFLAIQVLIRRGTALGPWAGTLLLAGTLAFALAALLFLVGLAGDAPPGYGPAGYVALTGWALFAAAGYSARRVPATSHTGGARRWAPDLIRKLLVPATAVFLAAAVVDLGFGAPARPETIVVVSLLALVLAVRTAQAINLADRDGDQRRQLTHTRALVDVTHALAGTTDLDETLRVISESARKVFGTRGAGIELITEDGRSLETRSAVGLPAEVMGLRFPLEGSFTGWVVRHQVARATVDPSRDPYIQPQSLSFLGRLPVAAAPIHFRGETLGALFACIRSDPFDARELELMGALAEQAAIAIQHARLFQQVTLMSVTDPLTGLANRRHLERELPREFAAARRGRDLAAVIFDLDSFKDYNDTYGHLAGDAALQAFGRALREEGRAMNLVARYGGDEFVAILSDTDAAGARTFVERVRIRFAESVARIGHGPVTVSAGLAVFTPDMEGPEALLRAADDELYRTKPHTRV